MHFRFLLLLLMFSKLCVSQDTVQVSQVDTLIPFLGKQSLRSHRYENRVVPFGSKNPLYVLITYEESKKANFEYFRIDSITYLVYEYFRNYKMSGSEGIKSRGSRVVKDSIIDKSITWSRRLGDQQIPATRNEHYFKEFSKEGEWEEYEDSSFNHIYWVGNYQNNKRVGLWRRIIYDSGEYFIIEELDYSIDSTQKIYTNNLAAVIPLDSLQKKLLGRWHLRSCDSEKEQRMFYWKCQTYENGYGDDCNEKWGKQNYYDFISNTKFVRQRGEGCNKFRESAIKGAWTIFEKNGGRYLQMKYTNGQIWELRILYFDSEFNLITNRQ